MQISDTVVQRLLSASKKIKEDELTKLIEQAKAEKLSLGEAAIKDNIVSEKDLVKLYAKEIDVPFVEINPQEVNKELLKQIPERIARKYNVALIGEEEDVKLVAMEDPDDVQAIDILHKELGKNLRIYISTKDDILSALDQYRENISSELTKVITDEDEAAAEEEVSEEDLAEDSPIAQTVNLIIEYAVKAGASDVHIEPRDKYVQVRYRVDGVLREANKLPKKILAALVSRIKILASLKIDERRAPQDGRFKINSNGRVFALRVSTLPVVDGEKVVMRILNESSDPLTLEELGFWGKSLKDLQKAAVQPHGMVLVTGPTGSGKSTTLYSVLSLINTPKVNISTVEDPVEYRIPGANQTQVNVKAGMTFANGLRALLRQDPNVIMVGEIRDAETAGLGVQAALTGHLVFSTLHTNNAATCLPRLLDMGIEPFLIASTVRAVVGQRLVRRLSPEQAEQFKPNEDELKEIEDMFGISSKDDWDKILKLAQEAAPILKMDKPNEIRFWRLKKDLEQGESGYKGRMGIYEVLAVSDNIQQQIVKNATSNEIQTKAIEEGMITMQIDGLVKAVLGLTSLQEILRVTRE